MLNADSIKNLPCTFIAGVVDVEGLPKPHLPEVAFAGRSNVGKSSLINAVLGRKDMARASKTPGRTRQLNFFNIGDKVMIVDLPGYGYAEASKTDIKGWTGLTKDYLCGRPNLRRVFLLLDARHKAKESDIEFMKMLDTSAVSFQTVLTKADKVKKGELEERVAETMALIKKHPAAMPEPVLTSAHENTGVQSLRAILIGFVK